MQGFLVINLNPTFQRTVVINHLQKGEVNRAEFNRFDIAGKGVNTTRVLHQLGARVSHLTHLGDGREILLDLCGREGLDILWEPASSAIRTCITLIDKVTGLTTEVVETTQPVDSDVVDLLRRRYKAELGACDWVILTGSRSPGYPADYFAEFTRIAMDHNLRLTADFRGPELIECLKIGLQLVKINLTEFVQTFLPELNASESDDNAVLDDVKEKLKEVSADGCDFVISRGGRDVIVAHRGYLKMVAVPQVKLKNTIGSGDAFTAGLCYALSKGKSLPAAAAEGAHCGSLNAGFLKPGSIRE